MSIDPDKLVEDIRTAQNKGRRNTKYDRQCKGKLKAATKDLADKLAEEKEKQHGSAFRSYYCQYCESWHLASVI